MVSGKLDTCQFKNAISTCMDPLAKYESCLFESSQGTVTGIEAGKRGIEYCDLKFYDPTQYEEKYECYATEGIPKNSDYCVEKYA